MQDLLYGHHRWLFINYLKGICRRTDGVGSAARLRGHLPQRHGRHVLDGKTSASPA
ncbi:MAG: hypothetical protein R2856_33960 [Caldilineaceae bacterium]